MSESARPSYRPALDGLRALAVAGVVGYHFLPGVVSGGWLGVDLFFVLSGFLITTLLANEQRLWGRISLLDFWLRRARRLLPGVVVVLAAVLVAICIWTPAGRRHAAAIDVLAALFYVANWRFILGDESYFAQLDLPSPVRHFWSLSIEEQFYVFFPLLLALLAALQLPRRTRTLVLAAIAAASAWWMMHLYAPGLDTSRIYYGTDTRLFELMIGAAVALAWRDSFGILPPRLSPIVRHGAWAALAAWLAAMVVIPEDAGIAFQGGLVVLALLASVMLLAASTSQSSPFQRVLSSEPLRRLGLISYPLYLWHWPVAVYLTPGRLHLPHPVAVPVQIGISVVLAWATYHWIERPIRSRGMSALVPHHSALSRTVAAATALAVVTGSIVIARAPVETAVAGPAPSGGATLTPPSYHPDRETSVTLMGNSVPESLYLGISGRQWPQTTIDSTTSFGCDPFDGTRVMPDGTDAKTLTECATWRKQWQDDIASTRPDIVVYFIPQTLLFDYRVGGTTYRVGTKAHDAFVTRALDGVRTRALDAGAKRFAVSNLACHRMPFADSSPELARINDDAAVKKLNATVATWAHDSNVPVIDSFKALCTNGFHDAISDGSTSVVLYQDGLHFTSASAVVFWEWMMPQVQRYALEPR